MLDCATCENIWIMFKNIFVQLFWSSFGSFVLVFPSRSLSVTIDIQTDLKMKHL